MRRESRAFSRVGRSVLSGVSALMLVIILVCGRLGAEYVMIRLVSITMPLFNERFGMCVFRGAFDSANTPQTLWKRIWVS